MVKKYKAAVCLAFAVIIVSICTFSVSADTENVQPLALNSMNSASVERTKALGILSEQDLSLAAGGKITRAEFCAWAVKMLGLQTPSGTQHFEDVSDDYWAADYINIARDINLISEAREFHPDAPVQHSEAVKILVQAAGYEAAAIDSGGWPSGYMVTASRMGITKGLSSGSGELTRFDAVKMIDNTLDVNVMETAYNGGYKQSDGSVLSEYLKIKVYHNVLIKGVEKKERKICVALDNEEKWFDTAPGIDPALIIEDEVDLYVSEDRFGERVVYIDFLGTVTVFYDFISEVNESGLGGEYTAGQLDKICFRNADKEYRVNSDITVTLNDMDASDTPVALCEAFAKVVLRDGRVLKIEAYSLYEGGIIYHADPEMIKYTRGDVNDNVIDTLDTVEDLQLYIDGIPRTSMYDLKSDMLFDYYISPKEDKVILAASSRYGTKILNEMRGESLVLDGTEYRISPRYGLYVYSNTKSRYQHGGALTDYFNKSVKIFVDDNMYVRYIRISDDAENASSFLAVAMQVSQNTNLFGGDNGRIKLFKITGGQGEKIYEIDADRMKNSPIGMDYIRANAGSVEGKSFLRFTTNKENKIVRVEPVDLWGAATTHTGAIAKNSDYWVSNLYLRTATLFAAYNDNGEFKVKILDFEDNLREKTFESPVTIISDYNLMYNPKPSYVMFGKGAETHRSNGTQTGYVDEILYLEDDMVQVQFINKYGTDTYDLTKEFVDNNGLKENMLIEWYYDLFTEDPIRIHEKYDLSGNPDSRQTDNESYTSTAATGFYRADKIVYRDGDAVQFMVNGELTDLMPMNQYPCVYELVSVGGKNKLVENKGSNPLGYINQGDDVWFKLLTWGPEPRSVGIVIYDKRSITGD